MSLKTICLFFVVSCICTGCGVNIASEGVFTATPDFVTATLSSIPPPPATQIITLPPSTLSMAAEPLISPIEGTTTTQVNVRAETSTASGTLGLIGQFDKVQIIGRDASGSWYRILYVESSAGYGWIRAEYVQVDAPAEIPLVENVAGSGSGVSGLVIQNINVRNGPGTNHDSLGVLNPNDVVFITGKDPGSAWMQIEFMNAPDGKGWVASEFLQVNNPDSLPIIGDIAQEVEGIPLTPAPSQSPARNDGDSMSSPFAVVSFSPSGMRALQVHGDVSAPEGDTEDWLQLTSFTAKMLVEVKCSNHELHVELWSNEHNTGNVVLACGERNVIEMEPAQPYFFRLKANDSSNFQYIQYSLKISAVE